MKKQLLPLLAVVVLAAVFLASCREKGSAPPATKPVRVSATAAYEKYFGPPPTTDKGTCYAFVIYFPSAGKPGKVVPFPFFTFDQGSLMKVAVERLLGGMDVGSYRGEFSQPFAPGAHLRTISREGDLVKVDLGKDFLKVDADRQGMLDALSMTLTQFEGVKGVRLLSEGKAPDYATETLLPPESAVLEPGPPRLLSVTAMKEKGAKAVEEVNAFFDRPVEIRVLQMTARDGKPFVGEVYHSIFDMAAVLKPKDPSQFKAGMPVKVRWQVVDKVGRSAGGDGEFALEVREH
ncbi:GerMN domain-containing protein [Geobacter sp.]|uniref:GerMN domain-containing protein n=1 Tax=Geobacter sp. TaxID=46610 RepID=UPI0026090640|nr:GerMN domain-containing protein [Geobacter sp.]